MGVNSLLGVALHMTEGVVTGLLLAAHKKNELTLSKDKLFNKFQKRQKC
nr:hypothetical protein [Piscirickettsia salmonis]